MLKHPDWFGMSAGGFGWRVRARRPRRSHWSPITILGASPSPAPNRASTLSGVRRRFGLEVIAIALVLSACTAGPSGRPSPSEAASLFASPGPTVAVSSPAPPPGITFAPTATPPAAQPASIPIRGSADQIGNRVLMAPGPNGGLYVSIPRPPDGPVLVLLDRDGRPSPGWPLAFGQSSACWLLLPVADGSVRLACTRWDFPDATLWAFAFDASGRAMPGWPVNLGTGSSLYAGRMIGEELRILTGAVVPPDGAQEFWITSVGVDGVPHRGVRASIAGFAGMAGDYRTGSNEWAIGPDGVAYGTFQAFADGSTPKEAYAKAKSALFAVGSGGIAAGFPIAITGWASRPAFDGAGRVHLVVGSIHEPPTRMLVFDTAGQAATGGSGALDVAAPADAVVFPAGPVPVRGHLAPPLVGPDGTRFVVGGAAASGPVSAMGSPAAFWRSGAIIAIGPSGQPLAAGWPYRSDAGAQENSICCTAPSSLSFAAPAIGPDSVLYLLQSGRTSATGPSGGGSIVAIGPDGRVRPGWPRTLKRAGSGFWSVVVGSDETAFALAIERESAGYSATVLAIAPDSTVRYATTIVEP